MVKSMKKIPQEIPSEKACDKKGVDKETQIGHWTFRLNLNPHPTINYKGPSGIKGFLSLAELQKFKEIMERINAARKELNRFPFPRYSHETLMDLLELINMDETRE